MILQVKKPWQGKVAIRDKYVIEAQETGQDITIKCQGRQMHIPNEEIDPRITGRTKNPVADRFSKERHHLVYFDWKPEQDPQLTL